MGLVRRRAREGGLPAFVEENGLARVLAQAPVCLLLTDRNGEIVHRNAAAVAAARKATEDLGDVVLTQLRQGLRRLITEARTFPHSQVLHVEAGGRQAWAAMTVNELGEGYIATWADITAERERLRVLSETAEDLGAAVSSFDTVVAGLVRDTDEVSARADAVSSGAEQLTASIRGISHSTSAAATNTGTAVGAAGTASGRITQLGESSSQIGAVGQLIKSIADQTNLLALNATIEAARAGEAGKGFAVVAGEVKDLAQRTGEATGRIAQMIDAIQSDSVGAASSIEEIVGLIGQIEDEQTSIAGAVEEQSATASEISASVAAVARAAQSSAQAVDALKSAISTLNTKALTLNNLL
jgi:methyl-accepting chemotaxis protein